MVRMSNTKNRLSVTLDARTLEEAMKLTGAASKRETIVRAIDELVKREKRAALAKSIGTGVFGTSEAEFKRRRRRKRARSAR